MRGDVELAALVLALGMVVSAVVLGISLIIYCGRARTEIEKLSAGTWES